MIRGRRALFQYVRWYMNICIAWCFWESNWRFSCSYILVVRFDSSWMGGFRLGSGSGLVLVMERNVYVLFLLRPSSSDLNWVGLSCVIYHFDLVFLKI